MSYRPETIYLRRAYAVKLGACVVLLLAGVLALWHQGGV
jgi:hypothetical protein